MKFKILKGTELFDKLIKLKKRFEFVDSKAKEVMKELGGLQYCKNQNKLAGGIAAIEFESKPEGYRAVGQSWQKLYYPKATNKKALKIISELPTIDYDELNKIVEFKAPQTVCSDGGIAWVSTVGLEWCDKYILLETAKGSTYKPPKDCIEILESEYEKLSKRK